MYESVHLLENIDDNKLHNYLTYICNINGVLSGSTLQCITHNASNHST